MGAIRNRKPFLISCFVLFTILYWAVFFPLFWLHTKPRFTRIVWITLLIAAVFLFLILVAITTYLVKRYNWWIGVGLSSSDRQKQNSYGFQAALHRYSSQVIVPQKCPPKESIELPTRKPGGRDQLMDPTELCKVVVDTPILSDKETQTDNNCTSPAVYRTSLIMDVQRSPNSPSDSMRNSWFYPTLADYYKDKTMKLRARLDKAQQEQMNLEQQEQEQMQMQQGLQITGQSSHLQPVSISDTRLFLKREQVYRNLETR